MCQIIYVRAPDRLYLALALVLGGVVVGTVGTPAEAHAEEWARPRIVFALAPDTASPASPTPRGPLKGSPLGWAQACSFRNALCVVAAPGTDDHATLAALAAADRAWETLTQTLGVPEPDGASGSPWRIFLVDDVEGGGTAEATGRDPVAHYDRVASIGLVDRRSPSGCELELAVARAIARGSLWRTAPATDAGSAVAQSEALARLASPCSAGTEDARAFQSHPERTIVDSSKPEFARGASAFFDWLDGRFASQAPQPGALVTALWALAPTRTPFEALTWAPKPNGFEVLRASLKGALSSGSTLDDVLVRFAVDRASMSPPPAVALDTAWPVSPHRFVSSDPPSATGASYIKVSHAGAPPGAKLRFIAQWEDYGRMRWVVLKVGRSGEALAELDVTSPERATRAAMVVEGIDDVDHLLVVGVNLGSTEYAFDPGQGSWTSHGWLLTLESG
jgi:hypothetical protein